MRQDPSCCEMDEPFCETGAETDFLASLTASPADELDARLASLTAQERKILDHIVRGHCNKDICKALDIEITTAKAHTSRIFKKLGVKNRVQAAVMRLWAILLTREAGAGEIRETKSHKAPLPSDARPPRNLDSLRLLQRETQ